MKKLSLNKETIRRLDASSLRQVVGGTGAPEASGQTNTYFCPTCHCSNPCTVTWQETYCGACDYPQTKTCPAETVTCGDVGELSRVDTACFSVDCHPNTGPFQGPPNDHPVYPGFSY